MRRTIVTLDTKDGKEERGDGYVSRIIGVSNNQ